MLFQDAPPDTSGYLTLGYAIFFAISIIYVISLAVRRRNLERDLQTLEAMEGEAGATTSARRKRPANGGRKPRR